MYAKKHSKCKLIMWGLLLTLVVGGCATDKDNSAAGKEEFQIPADDFAVDNLQGEALEERFSLEESLYRVEQIEDILTSFRELTEECQGRLPSEVVAAVGNTGWEMQHLGFHNLPRTIEGSLLWQDYQIKKLEYALAIEKYAGDEIKAKDVEKAQGACRGAKDKMQEFLDHLIIAD